MALLFPTLQFLDPNYTAYARPLALGKIYLYEANSTTPKAAYTDSTENTQLANPIILNSNGQPEASGVPCGIWLSSDGLYKIVIKNAAGSTLQEIDNITGLGSTLTFFSTLSANLDTNGYSLVTTSVNQNIPITPNGSGSVKVTNLQAITDVDMNGQDLIMDSGSSIQDDSNNEYIKFTKTTTAVNEITVTNAATGTNPQISATGDDTNIGLDFLAKGTGVYNFKATASNATDLRLYEDTDNGTNYSTIRPAQTLANDNGILVLPTVNMTCPTALPSQLSLLSYSSTGIISTIATPASRKLLSSDQSGSIVADGMEGRLGLLLGTLNSGNSWASTSILNSANYTAWRLVVKNMTGSTNTTNLGLQFYDNGGYITSVYNYSNNGYDIGGTIRQNNAVGDTNFILSNPSGAAPPLVQSGILEIRIANNVLYMHGWTYAQIAASSGATTGTIFNGTNTTSLNGGVPEGLKALVSGGSISSGSIDVYAIG